MKDIVRKYNERYPNLSDSPEFPKIEAAFSKDMLDSIEKNILLWEETDIIKVNDYDLSLYREDGESVFQDAIAWWSGLSDTQSFIDNFGDKREELSKGFDKVIDNLMESAKEFRYMMLDRLKQDCNYIMGYGNYNENYLWGKNVVDHVAAMKAIWNSFDDDSKPEWLTYFDILEFEDNMMEHKREKLSQMIDNINSNKAEKECESSDKDVNKDILERE